MRTRHVVQTDCKDVAVLFANYLSEKGDTTTRSDLPAGTNSLYHLAPITVKATLEMPDGTLHPFLFAGKNTLSLAPWDRVLSDTLPVTLKKGDIAWIRTYVSGPPWPQNLTLRPDFKEGWVANTDATAQPASTFTTVQSPDTLAYTPMAIMATPTGTDAGHRAVVALLGDSNIQGIYDTDENTGLRLPDNGFALRALLPANISYFQMGMQGESVSDLFSTNSANFRIRRSFLPDCTHAIVCYGNNDLSHQRSLTQVKNDLQAFWNLLSALHIKVWQCTIPPRTNSSTGQWDSADVQSPISPYFAAGPDSPRGQLNAWIRSQPTPLSGVIEYADTVETARDSGIWKFPGYTIDGIHPNGIGQAAIAKFVPISQFTVP